MKRSFWKCLIYRMDCLKTCWSSFLSCKSKICHFQLNVKDKSRLWMSWVCILTQNRNLMTGWCTRMGKRITFISWSILRTQNKFLIWPLWVMNSSLCQRLSSHSNLTPAVRKIFVSPNRFLWKVEIVWIS